MNLGLQKGYHICSALVIFITFVLCTNCNNIEDERLPNIIYILADDLGYGDVSCFNPQSKILTPNIDQLASTGIKCTNAHSGSAVCTPTRYGILTGRYAWRTWLKNGVTWSWDRPLIDSSRTTVANLLKQKNYNTACVGKWHLGLGWVKGENGKEDVRIPLTESPLNNGFDYFYGIAASLDIPPYVYIENNQSTSNTIDTIEPNKGKGFWRRGPIGDDFEMHTVLDNLTEKSVDFIKSNRGSKNPFFLYFPLPAPHTPILPTGSFIGKSQTNEYGDFVLMVDDLVGSVRKALIDIDQLENTLIIFTSDNGCSPMADFDELDSLGHHPSGIYRGHKADIFEGGHRVPFVASWEGVIKPGSSSDELICLTDLLATCAEFTQSEISDNTAEDSYSMMPIFDGASSMRDHAVHHSINGSFALRKDHWKAIFCPGSGGWSHPLPKDAKEKNLPALQLYDLTKDPGETSNVYLDQPEIITSMTTLMEEIIGRGRSTLGVPQKNDIEPELWFSAKSE